MISERLPLKLAVILCGFLILHLPVNEIHAFLLLVVLVAFVTFGRIHISSWRWAIAAALILTSNIVWHFAAPPKIEEGHNVFVTQAQQRTSVLEVGLPPQVYRFMSAELEAEYPVERRCGSEGGCAWIQGSPKQVFAFSADGVYDRPLYSRRVTAIDFDDPTWLRLGFTNDMMYNWYSHVSDLKRGYRDPRPWAVFHRWHLTMPWFVVYRFPQDFVGSNLCWRGDVFWEGAGDTFTHLHHQAKSCRVLAASDVGKRIFGIAVKPESLAMTLEPTAGVRALQILVPVLNIAAFAALIFLLVRCNWRDLILPTCLVGVALLVALLSDAALLGGFRYHDGGDDGLTYEGMARQMVQFALQGDVFNTLRANSDIFYYTPGSRYLRFVERLVFGDTNFGYLALLLSLPLILWNLFRRFVTTRWALVLLAIFIATPVGLVFGTNFFLHIQNASRGYGDSAAAIMFLGGLAFLIGRPHQTQTSCFSDAFLASSLFAISVLVRPNFAPMVGILLGGAGLAALWQKQFWRLAGMCVGFVPVTFAALHNWYYGGVFVLFSSNAGLPVVYVLPVTGYAKALVELFTLQFQGEHLVRAVEQISAYLTGSREWLVAIPVHIAAIAVLISVLASRNFDGWLRLITAAALVGHGFAVMFQIVPRYHLPIWLLSLLVCAVWLQEEGVPWLLGKAPNLKMAFAGRWSSAFGKLLQQFEDLIDDGSKYGRVRSKF